MALPTFIKDTGILYVLLLGLLLLVMVTPTSSEVTTTDTFSNSTATTGSTNSTSSAANTTTATQVVTTDSGSSTMMHIHQNTTNQTSPNMTQIHCPSFTCNYSDCYTMYNSRNFTPCGADAICQLKKQMEVYTASCSSSCADNCTASLNNCSVTCCNFTGCLNGSFASMMTTTTVIPTTTKTTTTTTATTTTPQTTANNGNKCYKGTCTDTDCYTTFKNTAPQICTSTEKHCQLKKDTVDSKVQWTAGCTANCSAQTPCKASTQPPCYLECCNATTTSCLWLNGTLNFPSSSTRGPYLHTELITCLLCLFAITLML